MSASPAPLAGFAVQHAFSVRLALESIDALERLVLRGRLAGEIRLRTAARPRTPDPARLEFVDGFELLANAVRKSTITVTVDAPPDVRLGRERARRQPVGVDPLMAVSPFGSGWNR